MMGTLALLGSLLVGPAGHWQRLPWLPDREGFAGSFAGVSGHALLVAGGANFPGKKPWQGGTKVWADTVFVLDRPDGQWKIAGKLPRPLGYGASVTYRGGVICVGGSDAERHYADVFRLDWKDGRLVTTKLPSLPQPVANACGALVNDSLYVAGGLREPNARATLNTVYRIDLAAAVPAWQALDPIPGGGRMLALAVGFDGAFWIVGGVDLVGGNGQAVERHYRKDAYRYDPGHGWRRVSDLPHALAAAPSPAPTDATGFYVLGGDDGSQVAVAPGRHRGFGKQILRYDLRKGQWVAVGELPAPRVTAPCVRWGELWVVPGGEARPGIRSLEVWGLATGKE